MATRRPICAQDERAALLLPSNITALAAVSIAVLLVGGNRVLARMSSRARQTAGVLEELFDDVAPDAVRLDRWASGPEFVARILADDSIPFAMVYGGERLGDALLARAQEGGAQKRILYEGPGKDPAIVFAGARIDAATDILVAAKFALSGQTCVAPENVLVDRHVHDELVARLVAACERAVVGDPAEMSTTIGPVVSPRVPRIVRNLLDDASRHGAEVVCGGTVDQRWVHPTVVTGVTPGMGLFQEETFAPVFAVSAFDTPADAIELARSTRFGLSCMTFGPQAAAAAAELRGESYAHPVDHLVYGRYGHVTIDRRLGPIPSRAPFGGYGKSGWIWDSDGLRQGPKSLLSESTVSTEQ